MTAEAIILADLYDLWTDEKSQPYPRPWLKKPAKTVGKGTRLTPDEFRSRWQALAAEAERKRLASTRPSEG